MKLSQLINDTIREIAYEESLKLCLIQEMFNNVESNTAEQLKKLSGCRQYYRFLHTSSLKVATLFMNATEHCLSVSSFFDDIDKYGSVEVSTSNLCSTPLPL